jgi:hypothetical protein
VRALLPPITWRDRERFGHDTVSPNLDLPDFFENLAGNHAKEFSTANHSKYANEISKNSFSRI